MNVLRSGKEVVLGHSEVAASLSTDLEQTRRTGIRRAWTVHCFSYLNHAYIKGERLTFGVSMELRASATAVAFRLGW